jgi:hypothetical protein
MCVLVLAVRFPSSYFYESQLKDGVTAAQRTAPFHAVSPALGPFVVWDLAEGQEGRKAGRGAGGSLHNRAEAEAAAALYAGKSSESMVGCEWHMLVHMLSSVRGIGGLSHAVCQ